MEEAGILEKITRSGFCYPALNQVRNRSAPSRPRSAGRQVEVLMRTSIILMQKIRLPRDDISLLKGPTSTERC